MCNARIACASFAGVAVRGSEKRQQKSLHEFAHFIVHLTYRVHNKATKQAELHPSNASKQLSHEGCVPYFITLSCLALDD